MNVDSGHSVNDIPLKNSFELLSSMDNHCKAAEELAIKTITSNDTPFINAFRELSRSDFWHIMKKHQNIFNTLEQALVLSGLTDYITCAYQNELFDMFRKKQDKDNFPQMLTHLNGKWMRFFHMLGHHDLTYSQVNSIVSLLRCALKRIPQIYCNVYISDALTMGEDFLKKAREPPVPSTMNLTKPKLSFGDTNENKSSAHILSPKQSMPDCSFQSKNRNAMRENKCSNSITKASNNSGQTLDVQRPTVDLTITGQLVKPGKRKYKSDITRYILISSENKNNDSLMTNLNTHTTVGKENISEKNSTADELDVLSETATCVTPENKQQLINMESPAKKKLATEEKYTNVRVNAFELMMKQSRANKEQKMKKKSLFP